MNVIACTRCIHASFKQTLYGFIGRQRLHNYTGDKRGLRFTYKINRQSSC